MPASRHQRWPIESSALVSALVNRRRREPPRILGDGDRQRAKTANRVRRKSQRALCRNHRRQRAGIGDAAENRQQQSAVDHRRDGAGRAFRDHQLEDFLAHALGRERRKAGPPGDACEVSGAVGLTLAIGGVNPEKPEDA